MRARQSRPSAARRTRGSKVQKGSDESPSLPPADLLPVEVELEGVDDLDARCASVKRMSAACAAATADRDSPAHLDARAAERRSRARAGMRGDGLVRAPRDSTRSWRAGSARGTPASLAASARMVQLSRAVHKKRSRGDADADATGALVSRAPQSRTEVGASGTHDMRGSRKKGASRCSLPRTDSVVGAAGPRRSVARRCAPGSTSGLPRSS